MPLEQGRINAVFEVGADEQSQPWKRLAQKQKIGGLFIAPVEHPRALGLHYYGRERTRGCASAAAAKAAAPPPLSLRRRTLDDRSQRPERAPARGFARR